MSNNITEKFTLYTSIKGEYEILDDTYYLCNCSTLEERKYESFDQIIEFFKSTDLNNALVYTYKLSMCGIYMQKTLNEMGFTQSLSNRLNTNEYNSFITETEWYTLNIKLKGKTIAVKNINCLLPLDISDYVKTFDLQPDVSQSAMLAYGINSFPKDIKLGNTIGATSLNYFKELHRKPTETSYKVKEFEDRYPTLPIELDHALRPAYRGGFCCLFKNNAENVRVIDVNTYYGSIAYNYELPVGTPAKVNPNHLEKFKNNLFIVKISIGDTTIKKGKIPCVSYISKSHTIWLKDTGNELVELSLTNYEYELFLESYDIGYITINELYVFKAGSTKYFRKYYDKWYGDKLEATATNNKGKRTVAKGFCNNLTGKFGAEATKKRIVGNECKETKQSLVYLPVIIFITSIARVNLIRVAQKFYDLDILVYCDTDSIHFIDNGIDLNELGIEVDDLKLGAFKDEGICDRAKYISPKTYIHETNGITDYKMAGCPLADKQIIPFDEFNADTEIRYHEFRKNLKTLEIHYVEVSRRIGA